MRLCERNLKTIYYALSKEDASILDTDGNETGDHRIIYENPVSIDVNVSASRGVADVEMFGVGLNYEKVVLTADMNCPISETSILWIDVTPVIGEGGTTETPNDYQVVRVAKSLNYIAYAIRKVEKS